MQGPQGHWGPTQGYGPPPKRGVSGIAIVGIILVCMVGGCITCVAIATHKTPEERAAEERARVEREAALAKQREADEAAEVESKKERAAANEALRKKCKMPHDVEVEVPTVDKVVDHCQAAVRMNAKVPSSVEFPSAREDTRGFVSDNGCNYIYTSWFAGQNAFGVKIRTRYQCTFDPVTTMPSIKTLN